MWGLKAFAKCEGSVSFQCSNTQDWVSFIRAILSGEGTWHQCLGVSVQERLPVQPVDDPFLVRSPQGVSSLLEAQSQVRFRASSTDVKEW